MLRMTNLVGFARQSAASVYLTNQTIDDERNNPTDAYAGYRLNSNGEAQYADTIAASYVAIAGQWLLSGSASNYECRATLNSGTLGSGTTGSWLALSSTRQWDVTQTVAGGAGANITVEIRLAGTSTVLDSAVIDLSAVVNP